MTEPLLGNSPMNMRRQTPASAATPTASNSAAAFPRTRMRRVRAHEWSRRLVAENSLTVNDLIWPLFLKAGSGRDPVASMPGVDRLGLDAAVESALEAVRLGIPAVALFPQTPVHLKTPDGAESTNPDNLVCTALRAIRKAAPGLGLIADIALDPYTSHGHDGLLEDGRILNDESVAVLVAQALVHAQGVFNKTMDDVAVGPTALVLQGLGQIPMVKREVRRQAALEHAIYQALVKVQALVVPGATS